MVKPIYLHGRSYYHMILLKKFSIMCFPGFSRGQNHRCVRDIIFIHVPTSPSCHFFPCQVIVVQLYIFEVQLMDFHDINGKN